MLTVATLFWQKNRHSKTFSRDYDESWVEKLYRGFARNLSDPFRFVCFTDREREFAEPIEQERIRDSHPSYATCIEPYRLGVPMILVGLDTVVTGNCDELAAYAMGANRFALPRDPYQPGIACNGVALVPEGHEVIALRHRGQNDMEWVRRFPHRFIDDLFPGQVESFKGRVEASGLGDTRIVYFHGDRKPHQLATPWLAEHWR
ncbi:hypothetical protein ATO13_21986 [Stappia sp. 22II-S9-Z10]|nr:hypothetical protein ATO13_21986 [Stappia sp. 22II-S9-Z10]